MRINDAFSSLTKKPKHQAALRLVLKHRVEVLKIDNSIYALFYQRQKAIQLLGIQHDILEDIFRIPRVSRAISAGIRRRVAYAVFIFMLLISSLIGLLIINKIRTDKDLLFDDGYSYRWSDSM